MTSSKNSRHYKTKREACKASGTTQGNGGYALIKHTGRAIVGTKKAPNNRALVVDAQMLAGYESRNASAPAELPRGTPPCERLGFARLIIIFLYGFT